MGRSGDDHDELRFPNRSGSVMNCPTSAMSSSPFFASAWDPIASLASHANFGSSSVVVSQPEFNTSPYHVIDRQGIGGASQISSHYPSDSSLVEMVSKFQCYGSGDFSDMVGSYGMNQCGQIGSSGCPPDYALNKDDNIESSSGNDAQFQDDHCLLKGDGALRASPNVKGKKRVADSNASIDISKDVDGEFQNDHCNESSDALKERDEKKQKTEAGTSVRGKSASKSGKDCSNDGEAPKEYIHVRARRGQATNSHSLAERVRREKISERMRLLQELVPGCNKITGKAVMLDEIINYVQSLQQQVEFLSMKLATVNPELNMDLERLLSKDILHSRGSNASLLGFNPGLNVNAYSNGLFQQGVPVAPSTTSQFPPLPRTVLENDTQSLFQMGYDSNPTMDGFGPIGRLKLELQNLEKMKGFNS